MKNKISDLRNHLFETLEALKDTDHPMEVNRALAISNVAQTIIDSAKVEIKAIEVIDGVQASEFFELDDIPQRLGKGFPPKLTGNNSSRSGSGIA